MPRSPSARCVRSTIALLGLALVGAVGCAPVAPSSTSDTLVSSGTLAAGESIVSATGYALVVLADGNVVLRRPTPAGPVNVWSSNTAGHPGARLVMQADGPLVVLETLQPGTNPETGETPPAVDTVLWSNQQAGTPGSFLVVQANGNLAQIQPVDGGSRRTVWTTGTGTDRTGVGCPTGANYGICERSASAARTDTAARAIKFAMSQIGVPYSATGRFGSIGYDCSGLLWTAYSHAGVDLGANVTSTMVESGGPRRSIAMAQVRPGDMVWYPGHIAMALSDGQIIEAAKPGTNVRVVSSVHRGFTRAVTVDAP